MRRENGLRVGRYAGRQPASKDQQERKQQAFDRLAFLLVFRRGPPQRGGVQPSRFAPFVFFVVLRGLRGWGGSPTPRAASGAMMCPLEVWPPSRPSTRLTA